MVLIDPRSMAMLYPLRTTCSASAKYGQSPIPSSRRYRTSTITNILRIGPERAILDVVFNPADALKVNIGRDWLVNFKPHMLAARSRSRSARPLKRHHQLLADRIDRRIGDLCKILEETVVKHPRLVGE